MEPRSSYPLFKGMTRVATFLLVPVVPLIMVMGAIGFVAMWTTPFVWAVSPAVWLVMWNITKTDDRAFRLWGLWLETTFRNKNKLFWGASTYSRASYRKGK